MKPIISKRDKKGIAGIVGIIVVIIVFAFMQLNATEINGVYLDKDRAVVDSLLTMIAETEWQGENPPKLNKSYKNYIVERAGKPSKVDSINVRIGGATDTVVPQPEYVFNLYHGGKHLQITFNLRYKDYHMNYRLPKGHTGEKFTPRDGTWPGFKLTAL